ncbi:MAG: hypothetical protein IKG97_08625, partial [Lachnospiraceae bacterium]|nr:hypothetical protein [Lachnospiraceae bacterium]
MESGQKKRVRYYEEGREDMHYRGPLSYRAFKILGWLCIALAQVVVLLNINMSMDPSSKEMFETPAMIMKSVSQLSVPFFLIANFSIILNATEGYHRQLIRNLLISLAIAAFSILVYRRYILGIGRMFFPSNTEAEQFIEWLLNMTNETGYLSFNLFIDLFLCSLLMFFLNYRPKHVFTGKKLGLFRACSLFPILYELASIILKYLAIEQKITIPVLVFPFLTVKPPIMFLVFVIMALFIKKRERRFIRNDRTHEEYQVFLQTNRNSFHFSGFAAILLLIAGIVDILSIIIFGIIVIMKDPEMIKNATGVAQRASALGLGQSAMLIFMSPLMLLFSYNRTHENRV